MTESISFEKGQPVVYPPFGVGTVQYVGPKMDVFGEMTESIAIKIHRKNMLISIPLESAIGLGLRHVISNKEAQKVIEILKAEPQMKEPDKNSKMQEKVVFRRINLEVYKKSLFECNIHEIAAIVRNLTFEKGITRSFDVKAEILKDATRILKNELAESGISEYTVSMILREIKDKSKQMQEKNKKNKGRKRTRKSQENLEMINVQPPILKHSPKTQSKSL